MTDVPDDRLLDQFARNGSEEAFAALVQRHIALVHSVALRHTVNPQHAEDITQAVFIILARKAGALGHKTVLPGWLYHTARLTAANFQRAETRRARREQEAFMQSKLEESPTDNLWRELSPQLDEAMAGLGTSERDALVLRYFQNKSMAEVATFLGLAENTAQKRVSRALEKLRKFFTKRGVDSTTAGIAENISAHSVQAVPVALAKTVTAVAVAKGATASASTLTLVKGALKIMAWVKAKTAVVVCATVILTASTATVAIVDHGNSSDYTQKGWQLWQARRWDEAAAMFNRAVGLDPKNVEAWSGLGWSSLNAGKSQEAEKDFQEAVSLHPDYPIALNGLGQLYLSQGKYNEAETYLLKAAPNVLAAWDGLAQLYLLQGKFDEAEKWAQKVVDSGQGDQISKNILQAAKEKRLPDNLRTILEPKN